MKILFLRPGLGIKKTKDLLIRTKEPLELLALCEFIPDYLKDRVKISLYDMHLEKLSYKNILLSENPDLVVFSYEEGLDKSIKEYSSLTKEIIPNALTAVIGDKEEDFLDIDFQLGDNPYLAFVELLLGIETERSIEEILVKVKSVRNKENMEEIKLNNISMEKRYSNMYNFLQYDEIYDLPSIKRFSMYSKVCEEMDKCELREITHIINDIENKNKRLYFEDRDIFLEGDRLTNLIEAMEEKDLKGIYIAKGDIHGTGNQRSLIERFSKLGLKVLVFELSFPDDEEGWIKIKEAIEIVRGNNIEPLFILREALTKEDEDALVFFLKENNEGLIYLKDEAYENNRNIYKDLSTSLKINFRWTKEFGVMEALRRSKKYKEALN